MKRYDKIENLPLVDVFSTYIEHNGPNLAYASRCTKIPYTTLAEWVKGTRGISQKNVEKIREFLKGDFLIDVDAIITYLMIQKELEESASRSK